MNRMHIVLVGFAFVVLAAGVWWEWKSSPGAVPVQTVSGPVVVSSEVISTQTPTSTKVVTTKPAPKPSPVFALATGETVASWSFKGVYAGNVELEKKAHADIQRLNGMFGTPGNTDYMLFVSIAGQYELLGDGAKEYEYILRALANDSTTTGLAWYNLGTLLSRFGAFKSARDAYSKAVSAQPSLDQYQTRYLEFLTQKFPTDEKAIGEAFASATAGLSGEQPTILEIRARWFEQTGRIKEAITDWKKIRELSPGSASAVNTEISRLEARL